MDDKRTEDAEDRRVARALRSVGVEVSSVWDLVNEARPYPEAIPILLQWLPKVTDDRIKEGIIRALTVKEARGIAAKPLIREFEESKDLYGAKWAAGNALSVVADDSVFGDLTRLARDKRHGKAREMVVVALGNMKNPRAVDVLVELLEDDEAAGHAIIALGKLKAKKARSYIEPFLSHPQQWIRTEAKRALAKIDRAR